MKFPFHIETNATWGKVENEVDWENQISNVQRLHPNDSREECLEHLLNCKLHQRGLDGHVPAFGHYVEFTGPLTLGEWLKETE